jgi:Fic family protein
MNREAVLSSRIEGTETDLTDLYAYNAGQLSLLSDDRTPKAYSDAQEVGNYVLALEFGLERVNTLPISLRLIREVHEKLMKGVRGGYSAPGQFRRVQNWIGPPGCSLEEATFVPPAVPVMETALHALEQFIQDDTSLPPLARIAAIHYQFEAIHPFGDGNGRVGRLLVVLLLVHWGILPVPLLYLSAFFERNRQEYYARLLAVSNDGDWHGWLTFFLQGVAEQSRDAITRAARLMDLQAEWRARITQARASALLLRLVDGLFEVPVLTISTAATFLEVTYKSAQQSVQKLVDAEILSQVNSGTSYGKLYIATAILNAVD